jgi:hypothetical protein
MAELFYISSFKEGSALHGGTLRSMQIRENLLETSHQLREIEFNFQLGIQSILGLPSMLSAGLAKKCFDGLTPAGALKLASLIYQVKQMVPVKSRVCLEVCGANSVLLGLALIAHGCEVVCFPHNIESFVHGVQTRLFKDEFSWMRSEVELYRRSGRVFCISSFDQAVVQCLGVAAEVFPYFPSDARLAWLSEIREHRYAEGQDGTLLLFSSVNNPPTKIAVERFIDNFQNIYNDGQRLVVAGRGTDSLKCYETQNVQVLGEIDETEAQLLQIRASISLIPVIQTTGFLTKLVENNLIGLPTLVMGDYQQATGLEHYGIFVGEISSLSGVMEVLNTAESQRFSNFQKPKINL